MAVNPEDIQLREVLFEFYREGNAVRVCAIDPRSNTEITMVGAAGYPEEVLKRMAIRKLKYVMAKNMTKHSG
ncbi:MAG: hypothetical protein WD407_02040 [Rhodospirillales bacterium]